MRLYGGGSLFAFALLASFSPLSNGAEPPDNVTEATKLSAASAAADDVGVDEIIITGTRLFDDDARQQSNALTSIDSTAIQAQGTTNLTNFLKQSPALIGSRDSYGAADTNANPGESGLELLNLRNLGISRTLVLVDGRRHVAALPGSAAVDVDTIPMALIDRIDILTGGASAIYGADGVSGVVNFVLKRNYEGLDATAQYGLSEQGDAATQLLNVVKGINFDGGRGNITVAAEYSSEDRLRGSDRGYSGARRTALVRNPLDPDDDPALPDLVPLRDIRFYDSSRGGWVDVDGDGIADFDGSDRPWNPGTIPFIEPYFQQGGDGTPEDDYFGDLTPKTERYTLNALFTYELLPQARFFSDLKYWKNTSFSVSNPSFDYSLLIAPDNAFLPANIAAAAAQASADAGETLPIYVSRDHFDLGVYGEDIDRDTVRSVFGFDGALGDSARYELSYVFGRTKVRNHIRNNRYNDRFAAALDSVIDPATGQAVCRSTLDPNAVSPNLDAQGWTAGSFTPGAGSGCVPINIFGDGAISKAAADWITTTSLATAELQQEVVQGYLSGDSKPLFELPAGAVDYVIGAEWRTEKSKSMPAAEDRAGLTFSNIAEPIRGRYEVAEVFSELRLPLLRDLPLARELSIDGAFRYSDYSTTGHASTWKTGFVYAPIEAVSLRGTRARATRAPNIGELFDPGGQTYEIIRDPCDTAALNSGSSFRQQNCAELLSSFGIDPDTYTDPNSAFVGGTLSGNQALKEEVAATRTLGLTVQPLETLVLSLDWYDIRLRNAINNAPAQEIANNCVDLPTLDNPFCSLLVRNAETGGIDDFTQQPVNVARFSTRGYDFGIAYLLRPSDLGISGDLGVFRFALAGNKLDEITFVKVPGAPADKDLGEAGAPDWQYNFDINWERGPVSVSYGYHYFARTQRFTDEQIAGEPDISDPRYFHYSAKKTHDLSARYRFLNGLSVYGGVNNLFDQEPDLGVAFYPVSAVGRFFFAGIQYSRPAR